MFERPVLLMRRLGPVALFAATLLTPSPASARPEARNTAVDSATIHAPSPSKQPPIVVRLFGTDRADLGTGAKKGKKKAALVAEQMKTSAPIALAQTLVSQLNEHGALGEALLESGAGNSADGLVLAGEFTMLNPGSRAKRFWLNLGAGRSRVCVEGRLETSSGELLLNFEHCRSGAGTWSFAGGRSEGMMYNDLTGTAERVATFLDAWARGQHGP